jgi:formylglycine-generating enzyme required for sulfatase activity
LAALGLALGNGLLNLGQKGVGPLSGLATNTPTVTISSTPPPEPTLTDTPTQTLTPTPTLTPTAKAIFAPPAGTTQISNKDGMVVLYVPAGEFSMGSADGLADTQPVHTVYLDAYWIDKTEVTNRMYSQCVEASACQPPALSGSGNRSIYYGLPQYQNFPVQLIGWTGANAYCTWAGRRLPTEAEWEKAARGTDGRIYPWGDSSPNSNLANYDPSVLETTAVGSYPAGASPYGALDMAGNVTEWVNDRYDASYYAHSPSSNPQGPTIGQAHVVRGGSWFYMQGLARPTVRNALNNTDTGGTVGFRCARSVTAEPIATSQPTITPLAAVKPTSVNSTQILLTYINRRDESVYLYKDGQYFATLTGGGNYSLYINKGSHALYWYSSFFGAAAKQGYLEMSFESDYIYEIQ